MGLQQQGQRRGGEAGFSAGTAGCGQLVAAVTFSRFVLAAG